MIGSKSLFFLNETIIKSVNDPINLEVKNRTRKSNHTREISNVNKYPEVIEIHLGCCTSTLSTASH